MEGALSTLANRIAGAREYQSAAANGRLLLTRDFGLVWTGQLVSQIGDMVSKLALLWFVYSITGSPLKTIIIGLLQTIPPIVLGPVIGIYIDRLPKKPILIVSDVCRAVLIGLIPCITPAESFTVSFLYALVLLHAIATAVFGPTLVASVPFLVARPQFTAANAWLQTTTSIGIILGPAMSGIGIALSSSQEVLCVNAVTYLVSAACLVPVRFSGTPHAPNRTKAPAGAASVRDLYEAGHFVFKTQPAIFLLLCIAALYCFGTSALTTLFPVFGRKLLNLGPIEVGYLWSALGIGLLLMSIGLMWLTEWNLCQRVKLIAAASGITGAAICALIWIQHALLAGLVMAIIGCGMGALTPIAWGIMQELSPRDMVGRVLAIYSTGAMTTSIAGITAFGWVTERFGESISIIGIGFVLLATGWVAARFSRRVSICVA